MKIIDITPKRGNTKLGMMNYIAECASVVRDKQPKSAEKLFNRLLTESVGDKASRVLEYIPCVVDFATFKEKPNPQQLFGFFEDDSPNARYYTTARELLNWGWSVKEMMKVIDFTHYKVFKCETPYFIYGQVATHEQLTTGFHVASNSQLTTVSHSQRYAKIDRGFWMPPEVTDVTQAQWNLGVAEKWRPLELQEVMRRNGITRKEVLDRGKDMLQMRVFTIGGFTNNPNAWGHFLEQRLDSHTQYETRLFAQGLDGFLTPTDDE